jgi:hypothetical protein
MRELRMDEVEFTIECLPEDLEIEGNASAWDDEEENRAYAAEIRRQLEHGNEWAWCCVKMTARWQGYTGVDYLGGCSYKSEKDFIESNDYYEQMKQCALDDLNANIEAAVFRGRKLEELLK